MTAQLITILVLAAIMSGSAELHGETGHWGYAAVKRFCLGALAGMCTILYMAQP